MKDLGVGGGVEDADLPCGDFYEVDVVRVVGVGDEYRGFRVCMAYGGESFTAGDAAGGEDVKVGEVGAGAWEDVHI